MKNHRSVILRAFQRISLIRREQGRRNPFYPSKKNCVLLDFFPEFEYFDNRLENSKLQLLRKDGDVLEKTSR